MKTRRRNKFRLLHPMERDVTVNQELVNTRVEYAAPRVLLNRTERRRLRAIQNRNCRASVLKL